MFFMCIKMLSFLFLFTCMCFVLFVHMKSSCKKRERGLKLPWYPHLLYYWRLPPLICRKLFVRTYFYLWLSVRIFPFYENLFCLWESLLIYDHLWKSFSFMRVFLNLFLFMIICENLFFLWESFWISSYLWSSVRISSYLWSIILLLIFYHTYPSVRTYSHLLLSLKIYFHLYAFILISMNWKSSWT